MINIDLQAISKAAAASAENPQQYIANIAAMVLDIAAKECCRIGFEVDGFKHDNVAYTCAAALEDTAKALMPTR